MYVCMYVCMYVNQLHMTTSCLCCNLHVSRSWEVVCKSGFVSVMGVGMLKAQHADIVLTIIVTFYCDACMF